ncbi:hypothetical protein SteCoe_15034 [Stentor coeruleus]|uniref:Uncharacterized protein n=1 Tax=Stentor coeruleus TaxID=5963 RepID=A0A1R2C4I6_9CILI|nr:hypothetical protein SteCoe_15034 [Stentor coeruleus]
MSSIHSSLERTSEATASSIEFSLLRSKLHNIELSFDTLDPEKIDAALSFLIENNANLKANDLDLYVEYLIVRGKCFIKQKILFQAKMVLLEADEISQVHFPQKRPQIFYLLASIYMQRGSHPQKARLLVNKAINLCLEFLKANETNETNDQRLSDCLAIGYLNCGILEISNGDSQKALESFSEGLRYIKNCEVSDWIYEKYYLLRNKLKVNTFFQMEFEEQDSEDVGSKEKIKPSKNLNCLLEFPTDNTDREIKTKDKDKDQSPNTGIENFALKISAIITNQALCFGNITDKAQKKKTINGSSNVSNNINNDHTGNRRTGKIITLLKNQNDDDLATTMKRCFILMKHFLAKRLNRIKRRSEFLYGYIAYGVRVINNHKYFISFKANIKKSFSLENSNTMLQGSLVILSAFPLEANCTKLKESCYIVGEILDMIGVISLDLARTYNQISLLDHIDTNQYGRIILKRPKANIVIQKRLLFKQKKVFEKGECIIKIFQSNSSTPDEVEIVTQRRGIKKIMFAVCKNLREIPKLCDRVKEVDGEVILSK